MLPHTHLVSADHVHPDYRFEDTPVRVSEYGGTGLFYAVHPKLGCGKNATTKEHAIRSLFADHACFGIRIEEVQRA